MLTSLESSVLDAVHKLGPRQASGHAVQRALGRRNAVYQVLHQLVSKGLVTCDWKDPQHTRGGQGKVRLYRITPRGRAVMRVAKEVAT